MRALSPTAPWPSACDAAPRAQKARAGRSAGVAPRDHAEDTRAIQLIPAIQEEEAAKGRRPHIHRQMRCALLRHALDGERAEFSVFLADLAQLLKLRVVTPSLNFFHAIPNLYDGAGRRRAIERSQLLCASAASSAYGKRTTAVRLDKSLHLERIFFRVIFGVGHVDFRDIVDGRFGLSVGRKISSEKNRGSG
jgi:hypothetical protein